MSHCVWSLVDVCTVNDEEKAKYISLARQCEIEALPLNWLEVGSLWRPSPQYFFWELKLQMGVCCGGLGRGPPFTTSPINTFFFARMTSDFFWDSGSSGS